MNPWLETISVTAIALLGVVFGRMFSRLQKFHWLWGYCLSAALIAVLVIARFSSTLSFVPPVIWLTAGRARFVVLALAVTTGLTTLLSRLPYRFERAAIRLLIIIVVVWFCVLPFLVPALIKPQLLSLRTVLDSSGICLQTKDYTCGPAAAVTALGRLGLTANEGEIAVLAHTSPVIGTLPHCLYAAIRDRYQADGLKCDYRYFDSIAQLKDAGVTLAVIRDALLSDHCVAVLDVSEQTVTIADPALGMVRMSYKQFERVWRFSGIVLKRDDA